MKVVSYNLRKHRAINELAALDERYSPDLMCLQECDTTDLPHHLGRPRAGHVDVGQPARARGVLPSRSLRVPGRAELRAQEVAARSPPAARPRASHRRAAARPRGTARARRRVVPRGAAHRAELAAPPPDQVGARAAAVPRARPADAHGRRLQLPRVQGQPGREGAGFRVRADAQRRPHLHAVQVLPRALRPGDVRRVRHRPRGDAAARVVRPPADPRRRPVRRTSPRSRPTS